MAKAAVGMPSTTAGGAGAAPPTEPSALHSFDHLLWGKASEHLAQGSVAVAGEIVLDALRVDPPAVTQYDALLPLEEAGLGRVKRALGVDGVIVEEVRDR